MVHEDTSPRQKNKPRGRPFPKGNKRGKLESDLLAFERHETSDGREIVEQEQEQHPTLDVQLPLKAVEMIQSVIETPQVTEIPKEVEMVESIDFINGENKLSIRYSRKQNRSFRLQVFLNDEMEIRPVTYQGSSTSYSFWNLLKGSLKKSKT